MSEESKPAPGAPPQPVFGISRDALAGIVAGNRAVLGLPPQEHAPDQQAAGGIDALKALAREWREKADEPDRKPASAAAYAIAARDLEERIAATPQPPPVSDLECKVCEQAGSPHGAAWAGSGYTAPEGGVTAGQAALKLAFENWFGSTGYDDDGMFGSDEMEFAFEAGAEAARDLAAQDARPAPELAAARADRDKLQGACQTLGMVVGLMSRDLYAMWIDVSRGDLEAVRERVLNSIPDVDDNEPDEQWNGTETGGEWFWRTGEAAS